MDRLTEMRVFATVIEEGGFTDAACKLGLSKSSISKHITNLESRLSARLLNRTTRHVSPTDIGLAYFDRTNRILQEIQAADELVAQLHGAPVGTLTIAAPPDLSAHVIVPHLGGFLDRHPEISVQMEPEKRPLDVVSQGIDMAIRCGDQPDSSLMARKLFSYSHCLVASPAYVARHGKPKRLNELSYHRILGCSNKAWEHWQATSAQSDDRPCSLTPAMQFDDPQTLLNAAVAGLGIACLPSYLGSDLRKRGRLVRILSDHPSPSTAVSILYPPGKHDQPKVRAFIDYLISRLNSGQFNADAL